MEKLTNYVTLHHHAIDTYIRTDIFRIILTLKGDRMKGCIAKYTKKHHDCFYAVFRIMVGLLFFQHGAQKLFGWFTDKGAVEWVSLMGVAGVIELVGGLAIAFGLYTRLAAFLGAGQMAVAYGMVHLKIGGGLAGWIPIMNQGELALLFLAAFLIILAHGSVKWGLEWKLTGKERF